MSTLEKLKQEAGAAARHGNFDGYFLVRITRRVKTRLGVAFEQNEQTIAIQNEDGSYTAWSSRNKARTGLPASAVYREI